MYDHDNLPEYIVIHHSWSPDTQDVQDWFSIYNYHVKTLGWSHVGYHYGIENVNGKARILYGRPEWYRGAHTEEQNANHKSIGICIVGNYDISPPPQELLDQLYILINDIYRRHKRMLPIKLHREFATYKSCPGKLFPVDEVRRKSQDIWNNIQEVMTPRKAVEVWSKRILSDGQKVVGMQGLWNAILLNPTIDTDKVKALLMKTARYIEEKGV